MSGGYFAQDWPDEIAEKIENIIICNKNPEYGHNFSYEVVEKLMDAVKTIRTAAIYIHSIGELLTVYDGEEKFLKRLKEELK